VIKTGFLGISQVWERYECERVLYNDREYSQGKLPLAVPKGGKNLGFPVHNKLNLAFGS
jgi:hypothetical protein